MSSAVFPTLPGLTFPVTRSPVWSTTVQTSISGMETRIALQSYPRWKWELEFSVLRSAAAYGELQQLAGFFNALQGQFDTFLYQDPDDCTVTGQLLGLGDGVTQGFQLVRSFGGFDEPILAPHPVVAFQPYLNGVPVTGSMIGLAFWGSATPGLLTFHTPPASGVVITCDFSYYWPCRMTDDGAAFSMFLSQYYSLKKFSFMSVKN